MKKRVLSTKLLTKKEQLEFFSGIPFVSFKLLFYFEIYPSLFFGFFRQAARHLEPGRGGVRFLNVSQLSRSVLKGAQTPLGSLRTANSYKWRIINHYFGYHSHPRHVNPLVGCAAPLAQGVVVSPTDDAVCLLRPHPSPVLSTIHTDPPTRFIAYRFPRFFSQFFRCR